METSTRKRNENTETVKVEDLYFGCEDFTPRDFDWSKGYAETWEIIQPYDYEDFEGIEEDAEEKLGYYDYDNMQDSNTPMMSYFYPLPFHEDFDQEDARAIKDICLCLVYFNDSEEYALALTGGGMDLSWQIAEAHIRLGYLPPRHFVNLPKFGGSTKDARKTVIINAFLRVLESTKNRIESDAKRLNSLYE